MPSHGHNYSILPTLPPLGIIFLKGEVTDTEEILSAEEETE